jgi:putative hydrolase of the HAD superfamily
MRSVDLDTRSCELFERGFRDPETRFDPQVVEEEFGVGKPHREVYEALFETLGAEPSKTCSVGDNLEWDVGAPQSHGALGIWVDVGDAGLPASAVVKPDRIIRSIAELLES